MDKQIIIPINLFTLEQSIYIVDETDSKEFAKADVIHLPEVVGDLSIAQNIENIKIIGNKNYSEALAKEIKEYSLTNYANKTLNITIMEG